MNIVLNQSGLGSATRPSDLANFSYQLSPFDNPRLAETPFRRACPFFPDIISLLIPSVL